MKSFQEYAFEKATEEIFQEVGAMLGQMGKAFAGGALQQASGQSFDAQQAVQNPWQNPNLNQNLNPNLNQTTQNQNQAQNPFNLKNNPQYKKFLTGHDERSRALNQWMQRSHNIEALNQHYQGDAQRWKNDFQKTSGSWLGDQTQSPTMISQYFTKQLGLPAGVLQ